MNHVITVGDLFWPAITIGAIIVGICILAWIASIFSDAWRH